MNKVIQSIVKVTLVQGEIFNVSIGWAAWEACSATWKFKLKLIYDLQLVGQSVLVSGTHVGPATNFSFSLKFPLDICGFIS
jgi:hypothetical protein